METKGPKNKSLDHQTPIEDNTQTKLNGRAGPGFVHATNSNGNDYNVNEKEPIHQGASLVTQAAVASSEMGNTMNGMEKATLNGNSQNHRASELAQPITNGHVEGIKQGVSNIELNSEEDHDTNGLTGGETNRIPTVEVNGETREKGYVNHDIVGPEDEDDGEAQVIPDRDNAVSGPAKRKKKSKSKRGLVT